MRLIRLGISLCVARVDSSFDEAGVHTGYVMPCVPVQAAMQRPLPRTGKQRMTQTRIQWHEKNSPSLRASPITFMFSGSEV